MGLQAFLHFLARDVLAGTAYDVLVAADEVEQAGAIAIAEIATMYPAAAQHARRLGLVLEIAEHHGAIALHGFIVMPNAHNEPRGPKA